MIRRHLTNITIEIRAGKRILGVRPIVYMGRWISLQDLNQERLPLVFAEHLAERLKVKTE